MKFDRKTGNRERIFISKAVKYGDYSYDTPSLWQCLDVEDKMFLLKQENRKLR